MLRPCGTAHTVSRACGFKPQADTYGETRPGALRAVNRPWPVSPMSDAGFIRWRIVLGEQLDKRNFRRRILQAAVIEPTGAHRSHEGCPARLYRFREDAVAEVKARQLFP